MTEGTPKPVKIVHPEQDRQPSVPTIPVGPIIIGPTTFVHPELDVPVIRTPTEPSQPAKTP